MNFLFNALLQFVSSFIVAVSFGIICNVPRRVLVFCGITGGVGWIVYWLLSQSGITTALATLTGSVLVALFSGRFARFCKMPVTIFNIPGIVPLVPGGLAYTSIRHLAQGQYDDFMRVGVDTLLVAGAIALGLILAEVFNNNLRSFARKFRRII